MVSLSHMKRRDVMDHHDYHGYVVFTWKWKQMKHASLVL